MTKINQNHTLYYSNREQYSIYSSLGIFFQTLIYIGYINLTLASNYLMWHFIRLCNTQPNLILKMFGEKPFANGRAFVWQGCNGKNLMIITGFFPYFCTLKTNCPSQQSKFRKKNKEKLADASA